MTALIHIAAIIATLCLAAITLLHVAWLTGSTLWSDRAVPHASGSSGKPVIDFPRSVTAAVTAVFAMMALLPALAMGWLTLIPPRTASLLCLGAAFIFLVRAVGDFRYCGFFRRVQGTTFAHWDARLYSPLCLLLAACYGVLGTMPH